MDHHIDTIKRLEALAECEERYTSGQFLFPFGQIEYVDPFTLCIQYKEIFIDRLYDFSTDKERPFIIDCGGNVGLSVIRFKLQHPGSRVLVFEADPRICRVLQNNLASLGLADVQIECAAVWTSDGVAQFAAEGGEGGRLSSDGKLTVPTVRLADRFTAEVDLLKLDIEGAEWALLQDLYQTEALARVDNLIVEFHGWPNEARSLGKILTALDQLGFAFTFPWSFCEPGLIGPPEPTPFSYVKDGKFILFLHAWRPQARAERR